MIVYWAFVWMIDWYDEVCWGIYYWENFSDLLSKVDFKRFMAIRAMGYFYTSAV
jgi:hypothetical protein